MRGVEQAPSSVKTVKRPLNPLRSGEAFWVFGAAFTIRLVLWLRAIFFIQFRFSETEKNILIGSLHFALPGKLMKAYCNLLQGWTTLISGFVYFVYAVIASIGSWLLDLGSWGVFFFGVVILIQTIGQEFSG